MEHARPSSPSSSSPGRLTRAMRALPLTESILRVAIVRGGRIVDERTFRSGTVSVGPSERSTFVVVGIVARTAFRHGERGWAVVGSPASRGLVAAGGVTRDLSAIDGDLPLGDDARGKLVLGDATLLFQIAKAPPAAVRPQLPAGVLRGPAQDWTMTVLAAMSFLLHFGAVGSLYGDWGDRVQNDEADLAGFVQVLSERPRPPVVETPATPTDPAPDAAPTTREAQREAGRPSQRGTGPVSPGSARRSDPQAGLRFLEASDAVAIQVLGANSGGPATSSVLKSGDIPMDELGRIAASDRGVTPSNELPTSGSEKGIATGKGTIAEVLGPAGKDKASGGDGTRTAVAAPTFDVGRSPSQAPPSIPKPDGPLAGARIAVRRCYERALSTNPDLAGSIRFALALAPDGRVASVTATPSGNLGEVVGCVQGVLKGLRFDNPEGVAASVSGSFTFINRK